MLKDSIISIQNLMNGLTGRHICTLLFSHQPSTYTIVFQVQVAGVSRRSL